MRITLTGDAEEVARLEITLDIIEGVCRALSNDKAFKKWNGFGIAIQAYQTAAPFIIDHMHDLAVRYSRKFQVRLVKGAYWDGEIKHAHDNGFKGYPVYTRKSNTDVSYLICAQKFLASRDALYPMFGTHNAHTVASVISMAGDANGYDFQ